MWYPLVSVTLSEVEQILAENIKIELNKDKYFPNEIITARVSSDALPFDLSSGLNFELLYRGHGSGNTKAVLVERKKVFKVLVDAEARSEYRVEFVVPESPLTYHGKVLNIDWYIKAVGERSSLGKKTISKVDFIVLPLPREHLPDGIESIQSIDGEITKSSKSSLVTLFVFTLPFVILFFAALYGSLTEGPILLFFAAIALLIASVNISTMYATVQNSRSTQNIGTVELVLDRESYFPGMTLRGRLRFTPAKKLHINAITISILGRELVSRGFVTSPTTHSHELLNETVLLVPPFNPSPKEEVEFPFNIVLPIEPYYSHAMSDNYLRWEIITHIDVLGGSDFNNRWGFSVRG